METLFIPKKLRVGFRNNEKAMTDILAFVTYYNEKGKLSQEVSFDKWRDHSIPCIELDNVPRSGYLINRTINHIAYDFGKDRVRFRIHSADNFEFEVTPLNIEYILTVCDISKREIADNCVFAWSGRNLVLVPTSSEQYRNAQEFTERIENFKTISKESMSQGLQPMDILVDKKGNEVVYFGEQAFLLYKDFRKMNREWFDLKDGSWKLNMPLKRRALGFNVQTLDGGEHWISPLQRLESINLLSHEKTDKSLKDFKLSKHSISLEDLKVSMNDQLNWGFEGSRYSKLPAILPDQKVLTLDIKEYSAIQTTQLFSMDYAGEGLYSLIQKKDYKKVKGFFVNRSFDVIDFNVELVNGIYNYQFTNSRTGEEIVFNRLTVTKEDRHPMLEHNGVIFRDYARWGLNLTDYELE